MEDLPQETQFLARHDQFRRRVVPGRTPDFLLRFLRQNSGRLSMRAGEGLFAAMNDAIQSRGRTYNE